MLVLISDLHLTDDTAGEAAKAGTPKGFAGRLREMAVAASWRTDGQYRPIEQIDLVLLGDILDPIRSTSWITDTKARPWDDPASAELLQHLTEATGNILSYNEPALSALRNISRGRVKIPSAAGPLSHTVPVRIHYMVGNHDWFLRLPGPGYDKIRRLVVSELGLSNDASRPFPYVPEDDPALLEIARQHRAFFRHGDVFDPVNYDGDRCASSFGDAVLIELIGRFLIELSSELGADLPDAVLRELREVDHVVPETAIPAWINGVLERNCPADVQKRLRRAWDSLVDAFFNTDFMRQRDSWSPFDTVNGLRRVLRLSGLLPLSWFVNLINWIPLRVKKAAEESYVRYAMEEPALADYADYIVYGHTHFAETVPLDVVFGADGRRNCTYLNSGTWRRIHRKTLQNPEENKFAVSTVMTYVAIFCGDERDGRPYETWSGELSAAKIGSLSKRRYVSE